MTGHPAASGYYERRCPNCKTLGRVPIALCAIERYPWRILSWCVACDGWATVRLPAEVAEELLPTFDTPYGMRLSRREIEDFEMSYDFFDQAAREELLG